MKTFLRNLRYLFNHELTTKALDLDKYLSECVEAELQAQWRAIRILKGEATGEFLPRRRIGGGDLGTRAVEILPLPHAIAVEVDKLMHPPVKRVKTAARAKPARSRKR